MLPADHVTQELKRTPLVVTSLMWKPFDVRFQDILEKIKLDQKIVQDELQFASMGGLKTAMQNAAANEREAMFARLSAIQANQQDEQARGKTLFALGPGCLQVCLEWHYVLTNAWPPLQSNSEALPRSGSAHLTIKLPWNRLKITELVVQTNGFNTILTLLHGGLLSLKVMGRAHHKIIPSCYGFVVSGIAA